MYSSQPSPIPPVSSSGTETSPAVTANMVSSPLAPESQPANEGRRNAAQEREDKEVLAQAVVDIYQGGRCCLHGGRSDYHRYYRFFRHGREKFQRRSLNDVGYVSGA